MPRRINDAIKADAQALLWNKSSKFDADEMGTPLVNRRWIKNKAQYSTKKQFLGGGILNWDAHVDALMASRLFKYRDASKGMWKDILDIWFDREQLGRGAIFAAHRIKDLIQSTHSSAAGERRTWHWQRCRMKCCITPLR